MVLSEELYYKFHLLLNKNARFENVKIDKGNFVLLFNREKDRWLSDKIEEYNSDDNIIHLQEFYITDKELKQISKKEMYYEYELPIDFFSFGSSYSIASKNECTINIYNYYFKNKDKSSFLNDEFKSPSFEFEESLCNISNNKFLVFFKNFEIQRTFISYYKEIEKIDLEGYIKIDGTLSKTINSNYSEFYLDQILDKIVTEVMKEWKDNAGFQLSKIQENFNK